jgi:hypothetical protein
LASDAAAPNAKVTIGFQDIIVRSKVLQVGDPPSVRLV